MNVQTPPTMGNPMIKRNAKLRRSSIVGEATV